MKKNISLLILAAIILPATLFSQSILQKRADRHYSLFHFVKAAELYYKAHLKDSANDYIITKMAESYRISGNSEEAEKWFEVLVNRDSVSNNKHIYYYAQALKSNGKYYDSDFWMKKYAEKVTEDSRIEEFLDALDYEAELNSDTSSIILFSTMICSDAGEFGPAYYNEKLIFSSSRGKSNILNPKHGWDNSLYLDMYTCEVDSHGLLSNVQPFSEELTTKFHEGPVSYDDNTKTLYFTRNFFERGIKQQEERTNNLKILISEKKNGNWKEGKEFEYNTMNYSVGHPSISADGKKLYFVSNKPGGLGGSDIYVCEKNDTSWGKPMNLGEKINTEGNEMFPFIHQSGILFFASNGHLGLGGLDLFSAIPIQDEFVLIDNLKAPFNTEKDDFSMIVDAEGKSGYFSSNRNGGRGNDDIYYFEKDVPFGIKITLKIKIIDIESGDEIDSVFVKNHDSSNKLLSESISYISKDYIIYAKPGEEYRLELKKKHYKDLSSSIPTEGFKPNHIYTIYLEMEKVHEFALEGTILEEIAKIPVKDVAVKMIDKTNGKEVFNNTTNKLGKFKMGLDDKKLNDSIHYEIALHKEGFLNKTAEFKTKLIKPGTVNLNEFLDLSVAEFTLGSDLGKMLHINPIYFDLNKHNIRKDAAEELDKVVEAMIENPGLIIELGSHTDSRGSDKYNMALSDRRAKSSANYIISKGIDKDRISGKGHGETKLVNKCSNGVRCSKEEHQLNRRTEFIIVKM